MPGHSRDSPGNGNAGPCGCGCGVPTGFSASDGAGGGGLPVPETQIEFFDEYGKAFIRVDMGWRQWKVAVEYDGVQHWQDSRQRAWDIERGAILESMGWTVIRVSAAMLRRPDAVIAWIRKRLRESGCPI
jgi:Protein of unknown function (DUF559)